MNHDIKAVFFDVDGTLFSHKLNDVPQSTKRSLKKLHEKGIKTVVVTGRAMEEYSKLPVNQLTFDDSVREAVERIREGEVTDVKIENGHVTCSLEGVTGRSLCLLVPYSKGWEAFRNGEPVQPDTVAGTMITIPLVNGRNEIELTYHIPYLREGICVSVAALAALLIDALCRWRAGRGKK